MWCEQTTKNTERAGRLLLADRGVLFEKWGETGGGTGMHNDSKLMKKPIKAMNSYKIGYLLGRCASGAEADCGTLNHAVTTKLVQRPLCPYNDWGRNRIPADDTIDAEVALCGARPGRRSVGWSYDNTSIQQTSVTCPRCRKKLEATT